MVARTNKPNAEAAVDAFTMLARLQQSVVAQRTGKDGIGPNGINIDRDTFERISGVVRHEYGDLRKALGGRLEMYDVTSLAIADPAGNGWMLKLSDASGQEIDFKIQRDVKQVNAWIRQNGGLPEVRITIDDKAALQQLVTMMERVPLDPDFKSECGAGTRYLAEAKRALAASLRPVRGREVSELDRALAKAATGTVADLERAIQLIVGCKWTFNNVGAAYANSNNAYCQIDLREKQGGWLQVPCTGVWNDSNDKIVDFTVVVQWGNLKGTPKKSGVANEEELRGWMKDFDIRDAGNMNANNGTGNMELTSKQGKQFAAALLRYGKGRKWNGTQLTWDTSNGSLGRLLGL